MIYVRTAILCYGVSKNYNHSFISNCVFYEQQILHYLNIDNIFKLNAQSTIAHLLFIF